MALAFPVCSKVYTSTPSSLLGPGLWVEDFWYTQSPFGRLGTEACVQSTLLSAKSISRDDTSQGSRGQSLMGPGQRSGVELTLWPILGFQIKQMIIDLI